MPGSITPLPVFEETAPKEEAEKPSTVVVRYGYQKLIAELPFDDEQRPACGTKLVIRTKRGIELAETLTTVCTNGGCDHSLTRSDMLDFIDKSGGSNYPFTTNGRVQRRATSEDIRDQEQLDQRKPEIIKMARGMIQELDLPMRLIEVELLLGGERIIFFYTSDQWVDFRDLVKQLASELQTRIEMVQVNAREEARLVADYERCGQHCCCKQFLKVLKPVSMKSAKIQKATLDPAKISGRCGRLMCCLRYEQQTYDEMRKSLPRRKSRVMTDDGPGTVVDTQILTQLALVSLDSGAGRVAFAVESIKPLSADEEKRLKEEAEREAKSASEKKRDRGGSPRVDKLVNKPKTDSDKSKDAQAQADDGSGGGSQKPQKKKRRRRRRRRKGDKGGDSSDGGGGGGGGND